MPTANEHLPFHSRTRISARIRLPLVLSTFAAVLVAATFVSRAANISLLANDGLGTSSFNSAGQWSNASAPVSTNDYFTSTFFLRTPADSSDHTFAGGSLTLQAFASANARSFLFKGGGYRTYTINNFTNSSGALINSGSSYADTCVITGNVMVVAGNCAIDANQSAFVVNSPLAGSGDLTNLNSGNHNYGVAYGGNNAAFTGRMISSSAYIIFNSPDAAPGNPAIATPDQFLFVGGSTLQDNAGASLTNINGGVTLAGATTFYTPNAGTNTVIAEPITDNGLGYALTKTGDGTLTLSGSNSFSGGITFGGGVLAIGTYGLGTGSSFAYNSGTIQWLPGSTADLSLLNPTFTANAVLDVGTNSVGFANSIGGGTASSLTKFGVGTLTLSNYCSYSGATVVSNGVLALAGSGSISSCTNIFIASGATFDVSGVSGGWTMGSPQLLSGSGTVTGAVVDAYATGIAPGSSGTAATLTINGSLTLGGTGGNDSLNLDLTNSPAIGDGTNDLLVVNGDLTLNGGTVVNVNFLSGNPGPGSYTIIKYSGTLTGDPATAFTPPSLGNRYTVTFSASAGAVVMTIIGEPQPLVWTGAASFEWDFSSINWTNTTTLGADLFSQGDSVTFNDSGNSASPIDLTTLMQPGAVVVNSSANYTFSSSSGVGGLAGSMSLTKSGSGTLILDETNSYSGPTIINGGTVQVDEGGTAGSLGSGVVTNNGSLIFDRSDATTMPAPIYGAGTVTMAGGDVTAAGSNYYSGATYVNSGIALLQNSAGLGDTNGAINVGSSGQLYMVANVDVGPKPLILAGSGPDGNGALRKGYAGPTTFYGPVTLTADTMLDVDGGATLTLTNAAGVDGSGANASLTLAGNGTGYLVGPLALGAGGLMVNGGTWTVAATNTFTGIITVAGGALRITGPDSLGTVPASFSPGQVALNGGTLEAATNMVLDQPNVGIAVDSDSGIAVDTNMTLVVSNTISGSSALTKSGPGTLVLNGNNPFSGTLNVDTFINYLGGSDGLTVIASTAALANVPAGAGTPYIYIRNNNAASSTLALDGSLGSVTIAPDISLAGRNVAVPSIENLAGNNTIAGNITVISGGSYYMIQSDAGTLTLSAPLPYFPSTPPSGRTLTFLGAGNVVASGGIEDIGSGTLPVSVIKTGTGILSFPAANTYSGFTTVSNGVLSLSGSISNGVVTVAGGLLVGSGAIGGAVTVLPGGTIEAGTTNALGNLTISNALVLGGNTVVKLNPTAGTNDVFSGLTSVTYGGTLTVNNLAGALTAGSHFTLFSAAASAGNFASIVGSPGAGLAYSFTNGILSVVAAPANISGLKFTASPVISGTSLTFSATNTGAGTAYLLSSTNLAAPISDWVPIWTNVFSGSSSFSTNLDNVVNPALTQQFYILSTTNL